MTKNILDHYNKVVVDKDYLKELEEKANENTYGFLVQRIRQKENEIKELKRLLDEQTIGTN